MFINPKEIRETVADHACKSRDWLVPRVWPSLIVILLMLILPGGSSAFSDIKVPTKYSNYSNSYCPFCRDSKLPEPAVKPSLQVTSNYPRLAPWDMGLYPLASATAKGLYKKLDAQAIRQEYLFSYDPAPYGFSRGLPDYPVHCLKEHQRFYTDKNKRGKDLVLEDCLQAWDIGFYRIPVFKTVVEKNPRLILSKIEITDYYDFFPLGKEAFVFFGDKSNPVNNLSLEQIIEIYRSQVTNWRELGGLDDPIVAYQWSRRSITQSIMVSYVMNGRITMSPTEHRSNFITNYSGVENKEYKHSRNAIGYCDRLNTRLYSPSSMIKLFSVDGVEPTDENIRSGRYPLSYEIFALVPKRPISEETRLVIKWLTGPEGQAYMRQVGYVPLAAD